MKERVGDGKLIIISMTASARAARTARSDKNTDTCPKTCNETVTGYTFYHTSKKYYKQTRKLENQSFQCQIRYEMLFNVRSQADISQLSLPHGTNN